MGGPSLEEKVQGLSDLELAVLLSLIAGQHCIIETEKDALDTLAEELKLIASKVFGLSHTILEGSASTVLDDFATGILVQEHAAGPSDHPPTALGTQEVSYFQPHRTNTNASLTAPLPYQDDADESRKIAHVVIAKNLDTTNQQIQIQTLELLRTKRIFTRTEINSAPKTFLFIALLAGNQARPSLVFHLNDYIFMSHYHSPDDGFPNLEEGGNTNDSDNSSTSSVVRKSPLVGVAAPDSAPPFSTKDIETLSLESSGVVVTIDVKRYIQNIVVFLRMHRAVAGGITSLSTQHFDLLVKCLAPLHAVHYVTPSLVALAARKVYPHRIAITSAENERSMQWGSDINAVSAMLDGISGEDIVEEVLGMVEVPL